MVNSTTFHMVISKIKPPSEKLKADWMSVILPLDWDYVDLDEKDVGRKAAGQ